MQMKATVLKCLLVGAAVLLSCVYDTSPPRVDGHRTPTFKLLNTREAVLNNLEVSYNKRNITRLDELLDAGFTSYFALDDFGNGVTPEQWGRTEEIATTTLLFDETLDDPRYPTCLNIRMHVEFENGVDWNELTPLSDPTETWYATTVFYDFMFYLKPDNTYIAAPGSTVQLTVRNAGTEDAPRWRLVEWRDLGGSSLVESSSRSAGGTKSWGVIKAIYR